MNINYIQLKSVVAVLKEVRDEIARIADCWERELAERGLNMRPPKADTTGPDPTITYTDEEEDVVREMMDRYKREEKEHD